MSKLAEISRRLINWARKWSAAREQAILWCQSKLNRFAGTDPQHRYAESIYL